MWSNDNQCGALHSDDEGLEFRNSPGGYIIHDHDAGRQALEKTIIPKRTDGSIRIERDPDVIL